MYPYTGTLNPIGNASSEPELRILDSGKAVAKVDIAVGGNKAKNIDPVWYTVEWWDDWAYTAASTIQKGSRVMVNAAADRLRSEEWINKTSGEPRSKIVLTGHSFAIQPDTRNYSPDGSNRPPSGATQEPTQQASASAASNEPPPYHPEDDERPF